MNRDCFKRCDPYGFLNVTQAAQLELIDAIDSFRVLPVILDEIDVVGCCQ